jgi:hypothetical protein
MRRRKRQKAFIQGWNASLEEMWDLIAEMQDDTKNKQTLKALDEIESWIKKTMDYWGIYKDKS